MKIALVTLVPALKRANAGVMPIIATIGRVYCSEKENIMITLTENAKTQMADICEMQNKDVVRYELNGGGCGGIIGKFLTELHYEPESGDKTWSLGGDKVFVLDKFSIGFMDNGTIDFDEGKFMPSFKVTIPDKNSCGCGSSFVAT